MIIDSERIETTSGKIFALGFGRCPDSQVASDRPMEDELATARRHVADGRRIIARQRNLVERLGADGLDATAARELLAAFERSQALFENDLAALLKGK